MLLFILIPVAAVGGITWIYNAFKQSPNPDQEREMITDQLEKYGRKNKPE